MKNALIVLFILAAIFTAAEGKNEEPERRNIPECKAPELRNFTCKENIDLGLWDDIFCSKDFQLFVFRRESDIYFLDPDNSDQPVFVATFKDINDSKFVSGICIDNNVWVFSNSRSRGPLVFDLTNKRLSALDEPVPVIDLFSKVPYIQSWVFLKNNKSVYLEICSGNNIWFSFESGKWRTLPSDWSLDYFSANMDISVFDKPRNIFSSRRVSFGMEMKTGKETSEFPSRYPIPCIPYSWTDTNRAKFVEAQNENNHDGIVGASIDGTVFLQDFHIDDPYPRSVTMQNDWLIYLFSGYQNYSLWFAPAKKNVQPEFIDINVNEAIILGKAKCVFSVFSLSNYDSNLNIMNAFVYDANTSKKWNVLQGISELPLIEPHLRKKHYIMDNRKVRLINGFGKGDKQIALLMFLHQQCDERAVPAFSGLAIPQVRWRKDLLITSDGKRYSGKLLSKENHANLESIWLHNSGKLFIECYDTNEGKRNFQRIDINF